MDALKSRTGTQTFPQMFALSSMTDWVSLQFTNERTGSFQSSGCCAARKAGKEFLKSAGLSVESNGGYWDSSDLPKCSTQSSSDARTNKVTTIRAMLLIPQSVERRVLSAVKG